MDPMKSKARVGAAALALMALAGAAFGAVVTATLKGGYFAPSGQAFRDVYSGGPVFGVDLAVPVGGVFKIWAGADLFGKNGHLTVTGDPTKVRIIPVYLGLRGEFGKTSLRPYVGAAAAYFLFHESNLLGTVDDGGLGVLGQAGLLWKLGGAVWLDLHAGYRACTLKSEGEDPVEAALGGLCGGIGFAFRF
jgi:hypothetical protein